MAEAAGIITRVEAKNRRQDFVAAVFVLGGMEWGRGDELWAPTFFVSTIIILYVCILHRGTQFLFTPTDSWKDHVRVLNSQEDDDAPTFTLLEATFIHSFIHSFYSGNFISLYVPRTVCFCFLLFIHDYRIAVVGGKYGGWFEGSLIPSAWLYVVRVWGWWCVARKYGIWTERGWGWGWCCVAFWHHSESLLAATAKDE